MKFSKQNVGKGLTMAGRGRPPHITSIIQTICLRNSKSMPNSRSN